ncbi:MAG: phosphonate ABC transporter ATP-binding protein [Gammaproteobacteria bacterium]|nr:phosphonate ABC transporter ATP-binding protein [Gammaproteobacteria bacterium]
MLRVTNLSKHFGSVRAVDDVSMTAESSQMIGIIGKSGAGKSTLLRIINRLTEPTGGGIIVNGTNVLTLKGTAMRAWQRECAMIFQQFNLVPRLDVLTNVMLGRLNTVSTVRSTLKLFTREERHEALKILDRFGVAQTALQRAQTLSGGQQQRVAICRAMMQRPSFILADEPIASLDPLNARLVMEALRSIRDSDGITVLCNLHTLDTARNYCDRIIGMRDGKIVFDGLPDTLTDDVARDIYGAEADDAFEASVTSTSLPNQETTEEKLVVNM